MHGKRIVLQHSAKGEMEMGRMRRTATKQQENQTKRSQKEVEDDEEDDVWRHILANERMKSAEGRGRRWNRRILGMVTKLIKGESHALLASFLPWWIDLR